MPPAGHRSHNIWSAAAAVLTLALTATILYDLAPWVRGHLGDEPTMGGWRWRYEPSRRLEPLLQMVAALMVLAYTTYALLKSPGKRTSVIFVISILIAGLFFQYSAIGFRHKHTAVPIAWRTQVIFLEDYFEPARHIASPLDAYRQLPELRAEYGHARLHTHPPGMTAIYRIAATIQESFPRALGTWTSLFRNYFYHDKQARALPAAWVFALGIGTIVKALGLWVGLLGTVLLVKALTPPGRAPHAWACVAGLAVIPAIALFSVCIDQLIMGLSVFATGALLWSFRSSRRWFFAVMAGFSLFFLSQFGFQITATGWLIAVSSIVLFLQRKSSRIRRQMIWKSLLTLSVFLSLLLALYLTTGYNYLLDLLHGIQNHANHPSQIYRSRQAWLFYNNWDMLMFAGFGWLVLFPYIACRKLLRHPLTIALGSTWILLLARDAVRGETARIMLFLFPYTLVVLWTSMPEKPTKQVIIAVILAGAQTIGFATALNLF